MVKTKTFDEVAEKFSKANKDATAMAKTKLKKLAELKASQGAYELQLIDEREALEQAMITPGKDVVAAFEQVTISETKLDFVNQVIQALFPDKVGK